MKWLFILIILSINAAAQDGASYFPVIQTKGHYGFIFAHSEHVQNTAGAFPRAIEVEITKQKVDSSTWNACRCYPVKGWSLSYTDYNTAILGQAVTAAYFLEPAYRIGKQVQFRLRGGIGLSYLTNPHHPQHNPTNMSYSMALGGYLQLGVGAAIQVAPQWMVQAGAQYQHISNGGIKEPNKGINWPTVSAGVTWYPKPFNLPSYSTQRFAVYDKRPYWEAATWFAARQGRSYDGSTPRTMIGGILVQVNKQVGPTSALNAGMEMSYDHSLYQRLKFDSATGSPVRAGLLAGHEFLLGKFYFSQQLGYYVYSSSPYYNRLYHRWALRYRFHQNWLAGIGFKAHKQVADFIDFRLVYRFSRRD